MIPPRVVERVEGRDATAMAAAVRSGDVSAVELVQASLDRIDARDGEVNAFTVVLHEQALAEARAVDATGRESRGPLAGVPISVKDHIWLAGQPATNGSLALKDFVPTESAACVDRLRAAGAIVVGKTNNPEFCYRGYTDNEVFGPTRNPHDLARTPGGSSGGAGASVAYGATPIALGTDGGGSIRIPAAFCGVVGHKPTFGLVPKMPGFRGWPTLSVDGPLTCTVRDAALALRVMAGPHHADNLSQPSPGPLVEELVSLRVSRASARPEEPSDEASRREPSAEALDLTTLRIAVSEDLGWAPVDPAVREAFRRAVDALADRGARLTEAHPDAPYPTELWNAIALPEGFASEGPLLDHPGIDDTTRDIVEAGRAASAADYLDAQERRREFTRTWESFFDDHDVLLAPSMPVPAFGTDVPGPTEIDGVPVDPFFDDWCALALPANLTGQPATAVPTGTSPDGLPVGLQVIGPRWSDALTLAVAAELSGGPGD